MTMIRPEELRIGNLVTNEFHESFGDIIKVESIHEKGINVVASDDNKPYGMASPLLDFEYTFGKLKPIPLTEAWLLKCGGDVRAFATGILIDRFRFLWKNAYDYWYVIDMHNNTYLTKIEYVHELQNFYMAMNGEELKIAE
jgi:hypothetical protein